jgi:hypothetical protein
LPATTRVTTGLSHASPPPATTNVDVGSTVDARGRLVVNAVGDATGGAIGVAGLLSRRGV